MRFDPMDFSRLIKNNATRKEVIVLILCLLIGFALRFYAFDKKSLWIDEIHTFNESRDDLQGQLRYYQENPTNLHPPLFFIFTHIFYPFSKPERDLRIIPLIFGTLSIPMIYFLARSFSHAIALPCALSLTFMAYHISLSQDGRSYSLLMFLGMASLYFFMKHLQTLKRRYLAPVAFLFAILFLTSYSSIPFIALSQIFWLYRANEDGKKPGVLSFLILNVLTLAIIAPWIIFLVLNYKGQSMMHPIEEKVIVSFWGILYGIFHDWVPYAPLMIASALVLVLFPFFSKDRKNALILLVAFILPVSGLYLYCRLLNIAHFVTSRYFVNFLPLFFISIYLSLNVIEVKFERIKKFMRVKTVFVILFIASNMMILPLYYQSEKQDFRGLTNYLKLQLRDGDEIIIVGGGVAPIVCMLHYLGVYPEGRHYLIPFWKISEEEIESRISLISQKKKIIISGSKTHWVQRVTEGRRVWLLTGDMGAKTFKKNFPFAFKGYFDGSFLNFDRFPTNASMYLFLWDPSSPHEKGIDMPIE
jgi:uncharacterized membrane protein